MKKNGFIIVLVMVIIALIAGCGQQRQANSELTTMKKVVNNNDAPAAIGPYSQAIKANGMLFVSGQIPIDPATGQLVEGDIEVQTRQVMENLKAILAMENLSFANVVKSGVYLKNMEDFAVVNKIYGEYFPSEPPARACIQAARLPRDAAVEVDIIAVYK